MTKENRSTIQCSLNEVEIQISQPASYCVGLGKKLLCAWKRKQSDFATHLELLLI